MSALRQMKLAASDYAVPMSDEAINGWLQRIEMGTATPEEFRQYLTDTATSRFSWLGDQLQHGQSIRQILDPYVQTAARMLGIPPESIDFSDPKWIAALEYIDPGAGKKRQMTLEEWSTYVRGMYGWDQSKDAHDQVASFGMKLGKMFGKVG